MNDDELLELLKDLESDRVERKASLSDTTKIRQAICAFANDLPGHRQPGVLYVGVHDDGSCAGLAITDELLRTLADMKSDGNITPFPSLVVEKRTLGDCDLAVVLVQPSDAPPVRYRGRTWIRVGPRRDIASIEEESRLTERRRASNLPYDVQPISDAPQDALDLDFFEKVYLPAALPSDVLERNRRTLEQQLMSLRFLDTGPEPRPTFLGLLTLGKSPRDYLPGAYVQFLRIAGTELGDPIQDQKEIDGRLDEMMRRLDEILHAHIPVASNFTSGLLEVRRAEYPIVALQQLIRNAILHRDYAGTHAPVRVTWFRDRIEILSPGGLFGKVTPENFGTAGFTDYRNPDLAEVMKNLGYVQRFGFGIPTARSELRKNGNPDPEFDIRPTHVLALVRAPP